MRITSPARALCLATMIAFAPTTNMAKASTLFHLSLPSGNYSSYSASIPLVGAISSDQFVGVFFSRPSFIVTNPDYWEISLGVSVMGGSWEAFLLYLEGNVTTPRHLEVNGFYLSPGDLPLTLTIQSNVVFNDVIVSDTGFAVDILLPDGINATPLPGTLPLFASGLAALGLFCWRKRARRNFAPAA